MTADITVIERAFEIARGGKVADITELRQQLKQERFGSIELHLSSSPSLARQLSHMVRTSRAASA